MRKRWLKIIVALLFITVFIIIVGSMVLKYLNIPDTPAFKHDFTKDFLVKDAETLEGFHFRQTETRL